MISAASRAARGYAVTWSSCDRMRTGSGSLDTKAGAAGGCSQAPAPEAPPAIEGGSPSPGRHSLRSIRNEGKPTGCSVGVGVKRHPPAFSRFGASGSRQHGDRLAGGSLRCLLTATADEVVGRSMAASPDNRHFASIPKRDGTGLAPASARRAAQRGRDRFVTPDVNRVRRCSPARSGLLAPSRGRAKPGGTLLTPTPARPSSPLPL